MDTPEWIVIINENAVYEFKASDEKEAINKAIDAHYQKWHKIWDEKMSATDEVKAMMVDDGEIISSGQVKIIRIFNK